MAEYPSGEIANYAKEDTMQQTALKHPTFNLDDVLNSATVKKDKSVDGTCATV